MRAGSTVRERPIRWLIRTEIGKQDPRSLATSPPFSLGFFLWLVCTVGGRGERRDDARDARPR